MQKLNYLLAIAELKRLRVILWVSLHVNERVINNACAQKYLLSLYMLDSVPNPEGIKNESEVHYA